MFTGLVTEIGTVRAAKAFGDGRELHIASTAIQKRLAIGDSVSVNGVCLTAVEIGSDTFSVQAVGETLSKTTLGMLGTGDRVNLEPAAQLGDSLGGHIVQGHVDAISIVKSMRRATESWLLECGLERDQAALVVPRGSIAVDGVSLTVADVTGESFRVAIIPHTYSNTCFSSVKSGSRVNIEFDVIGKYVHRYLEQTLRGNAISPEMLSRLGY